MTRLDRPLPAARRRLFWRSLMLACASAALVYSFLHLGIVDVRRVAEAFADRWDMLGGTVLCLVAVIGATTVRHKLILSPVLPSSWGRVAAANVISVALGQWLPGSMAVIEVIRAGLLFQRPSEPNGGARVAAQLAIVSFVDRALGTGVMFWSGAIAAWFQARWFTRAGEGGDLIVFAAVSALLGSVLIVLPFSADARIVQRLAQWATQPSPRLFGRLLLALGTVLQQAGSSSRMWRRRPRVLFGALLASSFVNVLSPLAYYLASVALGNSIPFLLVVAAHPATVVGTLLPLGFAGFGAPQLVWVAQLAIFGVSAESVLSMTLVVNSLALAVQTILGVVGVLFYGDVTRAALAGHGRLGSEAAEAVVGCDS